VNGEDRLNKLELFAWVGEDEYGSGEIGLKQAVVPAGMIPIVAVRRDKVSRPGIVEQMEAIARTYRKKRYLIRFTVAEVIDQTEAGEPPLALT
jgi:hypothetical protein